MKKATNPGRLESRKAAASLVVSVFLIAAPMLRAQGPRVAYYYHPQTELSWARCDIRLLGGSAQKVPFLPVICASFRHAPMGTGNLEKDVAVEGRVVLAGNGIVKENVWDCYSGRRDDWTVGPIDVAGCVVLFCYDFADDIETKAGKEFPLARRIAEAAARKAAAVVVFSAAREYPFVTVGYDSEAGIPDIPVITVTEKSALDILDSAGVDGPGMLKSWTESKQPPQSQVLISRLSLRIDAKFAKTETKNFLFRYRAAEIPAAQMNELADVNEKALAFLFKLFAEEKDLKWDRLATFYFRDYDSKIFFTHHWGLGWATEEGTYMVHPGGAPNSPLAAHENAHILIGKNWGGSSSFLSEGIGKYAEAQAGDPGKNDRQTIDFLKAGKFFPLSELVDANIGAPGFKTDMGYPAAGSFVAFIIRTRGLKALKETYIQVARSEDGGKTDAPWQKALGQSLRELEREWLGSLAKSSPADAKAIRDYLERRAKEK